jgi:hypothetical protein
LPVLGDIGRETRRGDVPAERDRLQAFGEQPLVVVGVPGERLPDQHDEEQHPEDETEAVVAQRPLHRCSTPSTVKYTKPAAMTSSSNTN